MWSVWSQCSVACGNGTRSRLRSCTSPTPRHGGEMCHGIRHMNETCINEACRESKLIYVMHVYIFTFTMKNLHLQRVVFANL